LVFGIRELLWLQDSRELGEDSPLQGGPIQLEPIVFVSVDGDISALRVFADPPLTNAASIVVRVAAKYFSDPSQLGLYFSGSEERIDDGTEVKYLANSRRSPLAVHGL
jgi:hypothetical protein